MPLHRVVATLASLCFFFAVSIAQVSAPNCTSPAWQWTFNSETQSPCVVIAYLMATCNRGSYSIAPLHPGTSYTGAHDDSDNDLCYCNTVAYSLFSACDACQGQEWMIWSEWSSNCSSKVLPPSSFPNPVPLGIYVPHWALLDVTNENDWNANKSFSAGNFPELSPGSNIGSSSVSVTPTSSSASPTSSYTTSPTPSQASPSEDSSAKNNTKQNTAAIAGGVFAGVAVTAFAGVAVFFWRRRSSQAPPAVSAGVGASQPQPSRPDEVALLPLAESPITKFYDPNDPTTFPGYKGSPRLHIPSQVSISSNVGSRNTLPNAQTSLPRAKKYYGLPIV